MRTWKRRCRVSRAPRPFPARFYTPYVYGLYRLGASAEYVTRGIGTIGIPVRIGAPPEVALLRLSRVWQVWVICWTHLAAADVTRNLKLMA